MVNARRLLSECLSATGGFCTKVIGDVAMLSLFRYLDPEKYALEIQRDCHHELDVFYAEIKTSASMTVRSVNTLILKVHFGVHNDVKMVPAFLKCEALTSCLKSCDQPEVLYKVKN